MRKICKGLKNYIETPCLHFMAKKTRVQPYLAKVFDNQFNISHDLFNLMLDTAKTREDIDISWYAISQDIDLTDAQE